LNIPPSRARRQLAARLALHSKQNSEINTENGDDAEKAEHPENLNPFATDEDDDSDNEENDRDFSISDLDVEDGGKGLLVAGGKEESSLVDGKGSKNVGIPNPASVISSSNGTTHPLGIGRASFPSMWPFGSNSPKGNFAVADESTNHDDQGHFTGFSANVDDVQSSDSDNSSDEEVGYGDHALGGTDFGADGPEDFSGPKRRLSVTTEAKRRTILEDDDEDEEVVHVAMAEADAEAGKEAEKGHAEGDDEELVEIQHAEMQGVEGEAK
jgi:hypothetical protein